MTKKRLIQKIQQHIDTLPQGGLKESKRKEILSLKMSDSEYLYVGLSKKYNHIK
jgi:hypothetical protein